MPRPLLRFIALLLVPCLVGDPATASALAPRLLPRIIKLPNAGFITQALSPRAEWTHFFDRVGDALHQLAGNLKWAAEGFVPIRVQHGAEVEDYRELAQKRWLLFKSSSGVPPGGGRGDHPNQNELEQFDQFVASRKEAIPPYYKTVFEELLRYFGSV